MTKKKITKNNKVLMGMDPSNPKVRAAPESSDVVHY